MQGPLWRGGREARSRARRLAEAAELEEPEDFRLWEPTRRRDPSSGGGVEAGEGFSSIALSGGGIEVGAVATVGARSVARRIGEDEAG